MMTLTQPTLSTLLDRLFAESDALEAAREMESPSAEQRSGDRADYLQYYGRLKDQPLPVSRTTGKLLYLLVRSVRARNIVEFGTSFGISTLHLAAALRDNGGGRSILFSSMERRISIRPYFPCLRAVCVQVLLLLPTTRTRARSMLPASVPPSTAIYRSPLPKMSNCRCDCDGRSPEAVGHLSDRTTYQHFRNRSAFSS